MTNLERTPTEAEYATYCPDCGAFFSNVEEGYGWEECIECGESNCWDVEI